MEIRIGKSARNCTACGRPFEHEQELRSLVRIENQALQREDYCAPCWSPEHGVAAFSLWSSRFYDPKVAEQEPPEVFSPLRQAFYESAEASGREEMAKAYLAAQLLRRQKVFRLIKESADPDTEERIALFSDRFGNALVEVRDPNLTYEEMEEGRRTLLERLDALEGGDGDVDEGNTTGDSVEDGTGSREERDLENAAASGEDNDHVRAHER